MRGYGRRPSKTDTAGLRTRLLLRRGAQAFLPQLFYLRAIDCSLVLTRGYGRRPSKTDTAGLRTRLLLRRGAQAFLPQLFYLRAIDRDPARANRLAPVEGQFS